MISSEPGTDAAVPARPPAFPAAGGTGTGVPAAGAGVPAAAAGAGVPAAEAARSARTAAGVVSDGTGAAVAVPAGTAGAAGPSVGAAAATAVAEAELPAGLTTKLQVSLPEKAVGGHAPRGQPVLLPARALLLREGKPYVIKRHEPEPQQLAVRVLLVTGADALVSAVDEPALQPGDEVAADAGPYTTGGEAGEP